MGLVDATLEGVRISPARVRDAIAALVDLMARVDQQGSGGAWSPKERSFGRWYSWVHDAAVKASLSEAQGAETDAGAAAGLAAALTEWRYAARAEDGAVRVESFTGRSYGDDALLWQALAPCLDAGGSISWRGEDDDLWRFEFTGAGMKTMTGQITWREDV